MKFKNIMSAVIVSGGLLTSVNGFAFSDNKVQEEKHEVEIQHIRNATARVSYGDTTFLIDPMLAKKGAYPGFEGTYRSEIRNPMLELPEPAEDIIEDIDAIVVTHSHLDHWDQAAQQLLPKDLPLFTQHQADAELIRSQGFTDVRVLDGKAEFAGVTLNKVGGQHGTDRIFAIPGVADVMGEVMGVVFQAAGYKTTYIAGDTVWHAEVEQAIKQFQPEIIVLNTGAAKLEGIMDDSILMEKEDVLKAHKLAPLAHILAVHMDTLNHCVLTREEMRNYVEQQELEELILIPADGNTMSI